LRFEATPVLLTREFHESIRRSEIAGIRSGIETARRLRPDVRAASIDVAGGLAAFFGSKSPLSEAFGVGTLAPVTPDQIATITEFYESRGATSRVFVSPLAHSTLTSGLAAAGYAPTEYENVLASEDFKSHARRDDRIRIAADVHEWARASTAAFVDGASSEPDDEFVALFRRRGWQIAMIADRMARAREAGARFLRGTARPASSSERNFHRCGFVTLYTRALWERRPRRDEGS
jgi:hypothetical protein